MTTITQKRAMHMLSLISRDLIQKYEGDMETLITDLLTDLRHTADVCGFDFEFAMGLSQGHYEDELQEDLHEAALEAVKQRSRNRKRHDN